jgi:hypothetical protein
MATLQERLDEFKKAFESGAPPYNAPHEAIEKMHRATAELKASGIEKTALKVGDRAPAFSIFNQDHAQDLWWSASSEGIGDRTAIWSWRLYSRSIQKSKHWERRSS